MNDDNSNMKPWGPSWYPGIGYTMETKQWGSFPGDIQDSKGWSAPNVGRGMFTYAPTGKRFIGRGRLPPWACQYGELAERDAWVGRDIVGHFVLIRGITVPKETVANGVPVHVTEEGKKVCMDPDGFGPEFKMEGEPDPDVVPENMCWRFAYVGSYDSYTGKHGLIFKMADIYYQGHEVELEKCVFQEWVRPDMRKLMAGGGGDVKTIREDTNGTQWDNKDYNDGVLLAKKHAYQAAC